MSRDPRVEAAIGTHSAQAGEFAQAYGAMASDPHTTCFAYSRRRLDAWLEMLLPPPREHPRLLDVGCGTGHHLVRLRSRGFQVTGVDGSSEMLVEARRLNPDVELRLATVDDLPFPDGSFDAALSIEVVRYLPDPVAMLRECARVLRPGGVAVLTAAPRFSVNGYWLVNRLAVALPLPGLVRLKQFFTTSAALRRQLEESGFGSIEIHGVYWGPINWIERLAPRALPRVLRAWERFDVAWADRRPFRELSNMFVARAVREDRRT